MFRIVALLFSSLLVVALIAPVRGATIELREAQPAPADGEVPVAPQHLDLQGGELVRPATGDEQILRSPASGDPPVALPDAYAVHVGDTLVVDAARGILRNDIDPDGDVLIVTSYFPPENGDLSVVTNGSFTYVPTTSAAVADSFRYSLYDGSNYAVEDGVVHLTVLPASNRAPVATPDRYAVASGDTLDVPADAGLLVNDLDLDGDGFIAVSYSSPANGQANLVTNGRLTYVPAPGFQGTDSFSYRIRDDQGAYSGFGTVTIDVLEPSNRAPVAITDWYYTPEGTDLAVSAVEGLRVNDLDPDGDDFLLVSFSSPDHGALSVVTDGSFSFRPDPGFVGQDSFSYRLRDDRGAYADFGRCHLLVGIYGNIPTGVLTPPTPGGFALHAPAPNPFNPRTELSFRLAEEQRAQLRVYDLRGRVVATVLDEVRPAGEHTLTWDGVDDGGRRVASGSYVVELRAGAKRGVQRLTLLK